MFSKTEVQVAVIAGLFALVSIIPSVYMSNENNEAQAALQRAEDVREMKREYYDDLTEAFVTQLMYQDADGTVEQVEARQNFLLAASKVPLYASEEMVQFIESMKNPETAKNTGVENYYIIMRKDLCSDAFSAFEDIQTLTIYITDDVLVTDENGKKTVLKKDKE